MQKQFLLPLFIILVITNTTSSMTIDLSPEEIELQTIAISTALRLNPKEKFTGPDWEHLDRGLIETCKEHRKSDDPTVIRGTGPTFGQSKRNEEKDTHFSCAEIRDYKRKMNLKKIKSNKPNDPKITSSNEPKEIVKAPENLDQPTNSVRSRVPTPQGSGDHPEISSPGNLQVFLLATAVLTPILGIMGYIWYTKIKKPQEEPKVEAKRWYEKAWPFVRKKAFAQPA